MKNTYIILLLFTIYICVAFGTELDEDRGYTGTPATQSYRAGKAWCGTCRRVHRRGPLLFRRGTRPYGYRRTSVITWKKSYPKRRIYKVSTKNRSSDSLTKRKEETRRRYRNSYRTNRYPSRYRSYRRSYPRRYRSYRRSYPRRYRSYRRRDSRRDDYYEDSRDDYEDDSDEDSDENDSRDDSEEDSREDSEDDSRDDSEDDDESDLEENVSIKRRHKRCTPCRRYLNGFSPDCMKKYLHCKEQNESDDEDNDLEEFYNVLKQNKKTQQAHSKIMRKIHEKLGGG